MNDVSFQLEQIIRKRFPTVVVQPSGKDFDEYDLFRIPDDQLGAYLRYRIDELPESLEKLSLDHVVLISHSESDSLKYYADRLQMVREHSK